MTCDAPTGRAKAQQVAAMEQAKANRSIRWVALDEFNALRRGETSALSTRNDVTSRRVVLKNQINRVTGATTVLDEGGGGNLYAAEEYVYIDRLGVRSAALDVSVYVRVQDTTWAERARGLFARLARSGYGAKKTAGYGHFALANWSEFHGFDATPPDANGFISLANWVPRRGDPTEGAYTMFVKYGKLGEDAANSENPFKFPLMMLTAGSTFYADPPIREWYGRLVSGIAPADARVVQYGYAFAVAASMSKDEH
jgi:CRISPR-associated protein Csm4